MNLSSLNNHLPFILPSFKDCWKHVLTVFVVVMAVYMVTTPRFVTMEDSGNFVLYSYYGGVCHPPGYPLYAMMGKFFTYLPFSSMTYSVSLMSGFFGALSCAVVWWICRVILSKENRSAAVITSYLVSLAYGFSASFWSQAIIAEVYTLNSFLFFMVLALALAFNVKGRMRLLLACGFFVGLGLSNHYPLLLLATAFTLPFLLWSRFFAWYQEKKIKMLSLAFALPLLALVVGLFPYLHLYYRFQNDAIFSFCEPLTEMEHFLSFVGRDNYAKLENSASVTWWDKKMFSLYIGEQLFNQLNVVGGLLALCGLWFQWKRLPLSLALSLLCSFVGSTFLLAVLLHLDYDDFWKAVFRVYPLTSYGVWSIWMGLGLLAAFQVVVKTWDTKKYVLIASVLLLSVVALNWGDNSRRDDTWSRDFALATLNSLPLNAVYVTDADMDVGPIAYMHLIEGVRPDVTLYNGKGMGFKNRMIKAMRFNEEEAKLARREHVLSLYQLQEKKPNVFYTKETMPNKFGSTAMGMYRYVNKKAAPIKNAQGQVTSYEEEYAVSDEMLAYFHKIADMPTPRDWWSRMHREMLIGKFAATFTPLVYGKQATPESKKRLSPALEKASKFYLGNLRIAHMQWVVDYPDHDAIWKRLYDTENMMDDTVKKSDRAKLYSLMSQFSLNKRNLKKYEEYALRSIAEYPNHENSVIKKFKIYLQKNQRFAVLTELEEKYPKLMTPLPYPEPGIMVKIYRALTGLNDEGQKK